MVTVPIRSRPTRLRVQDLRSPAIHIQVRRSHLCAPVRMMKADVPSPEAYLHAAWLINVEPRALRALAEVEAGPAGGFNEDGTPVVLFERHVFHRLTGGRFHEARVPEITEDWATISYPKPGVYGPASAQHRRLQAAARLDRDAALRSASWGLFQIMGENHRIAGYPDIQKFVNAMYRSADDHLRALTMFIWNSPMVLHALRDRDWPVLARNYNGPEYRKNNWDVKMAEAYARIA